MQDVVKGLRAIARQLQAEGDTPSRGAPIVYIRTWSEFVDRLQDLQEEMQGFVDESLPPGILSEERRKELEDAVYQKFTDGTQPLVDAVHHLRQDHDYFLK